MDEETLDEIKAKLLEQLENPLLTEQAVSLIEKKLAVINSA